MPPEILINQIDDYRVKNKSSAIEKYLSGRKLRGFIKVLLDKLSISINPDNDKNMRALRFWTFEIRGHYSRIQINKAFLVYLIKILKTNSSELNGLNNTLTVHYRLGDLLSLTNKTYVPSTNLIKLIEDIYVGDRFHKILIFSDSIEIAEIKLEELAKFTNKIEYSNAPTLTVINNCLLSKYFIGTNSKVSYWIEILRQHSGKKSTIIGPN